MLGRLPANAPYRMRVYTSSKRYKGNKPILDITRKSGQECFAPSWNMIMAHKSEFMSDAEYTNLYLKKMRQSYKDYYSKWQDVLAMKEVVLVCYCHSNKFCHRHILREIFVKLGAIDGGELEVGVEGYFV